MSDPPSGWPHARRPAPVDQLFDVPRHPYRRRILTILAEANPRDDDEFTSEDLHAADEEMDRFTTELFHSHLPKLEEAGYID